MTPEALNDLLHGVVGICVLVGGPALGVALVVGLFVGVLQAATQINEASIAFTIKLAAVAVTVVAMGPWAMTQLVDYSRRTIQSAGELGR